MPYLLAKTTLLAVILGLCAFFAQAEAMPRFPLNEITAPATPVGYGRGYGGYGRWHGGYGGYGRGYGGYGRWYGGYGGYGRGYGGYGGYGRGCGRDYY